MKQEINMLRLTIIAVALVLVGCKDDDDTQSGDDFNRQAVLVNLADNVIIPAYDELGLKTENLKEASEIAQASLTLDNISALKTAWEEALRAWQWTALYDFGPAADQGLSASFNLFPVNAELINQNIASGVYNLEAASNISATGLQAIDYLLYGTADTDEALLNYFTDTPNALQYIVDIATLLDAKTVQTNTAWNTTYQSTFVNATGTDLGSSLGLMVNAGIKYFEIHLRDAKIGIPSGARSSDGTALPAQSEALYNGQISTSSLYESITAWQWFFNGTNIEGVVDGDGLDDYLAYLGTTYEGQPLADELNARFDQTLVNVTGLSNSISDVVVNEQTACLEIFDELQRIIVLLKVDMTSAMGIQITYVDNDGD